MAAGDLVLGSDGRPRCWWAGGSTLLERYHDEEWARGPRDEQGLFERLSLEAFQAGLSWKIVLERRDALRDAFHGFEPTAVAAMSVDDTEDVLARPGTIRNRAKVTAIVANAGLLVALHDRGLGLAQLTEDVVAAVPLDATPPQRRADVPATTPASEALAHRLRSLGWRFVGPTTAYAYLQAVGWADDHLTGCVARSASGPTDHLG